LISAASSTSLRLDRKFRRYHTEFQDHGLDKALDHRLIELAAPALERGEKVTIEMPIRNINRTVGTMLSGLVAKRYGHDGLPDDTIHARFAGSAGQSLGAFLSRGITLELIGDTNDYCGKGLSGGHIIVQPSPKFRGDAAQNIITGNAVLYGAIAGEAYFRGVAGERFAVRNSGAHTVVEGCRRSRLRVHDRRHGGSAGHDRAQLCGRHVRRHCLRLDADGSFASYCNTAMVKLEPLLTEVEQEAKVSRDVWHMGQADERAGKALHRKSPSPTPAASGRGRYFRIGRPREASS
jgi:glutamate synthase (NADPH) large chain